MKFLIKQGADVNAKPSALNSAIAANSSEIIKILIDAQAIVDLKGYNSFFSAVKARSADAIKDLLSHKPDFINQKNSQIMDIGGWPVVRFKECSPLAYTMLLMTNQNYFNEYFEILDVLKKIPNVQIDGVQCIELSGYSKDQEKNLSLKNIFRHYTNKNYHDLTRKKRYNDLKTWIESLK